MGAIWQSRDLYTDLVPTEPHDLGLARERRSFHAEPLHSERRELQQNLFLEPCNVSGSHQGFDPCAEAALLHRGVEQHYIECALRSQRLGRARKLLGRHIVDVSAEHVQMLGMSMARAFFADGRAGGFPQYHSNRIQLTTDVPRSRTVAATSGAIFRGRLTLRENLEQGRSCRSRQLAGPVRTMRNRKTLQ